MIEKIIPADFDIFEEGGQTFYSFNIEVIKSSAQTENIVILANLKNLILSMQRVDMFDNIFEHETHYSLYMKSSNLFLLKQFYEVFKGIADLSNSKSRNVFAEKIVQAPPPKIKAVPQKKKGNALFDFFKKKR